MERTLQKVKTGFRVVFNTTAGIAPLEHGMPEGIYGYVSHSSMSLQYSGVDEPGDALDLPRDPEALRDLAKALCLVADFWDKNSRGFLPWSMHDL